MTVEEPTSVPTTEQQATVVAEPAEALADTTALTEVDSASTDKPPVKRTSLFNSLSKSIKNHTNGAPAMTTSSTMATEQNALERKFSKSFDALLQKVKGNAKTKPGTDEVTSTPEILDGSLAADPESVSPADATAASTDETGHEASPTDKGDKAQQPPLIKRQSILGKLFVSTRKKAEPPVHSQDKAASAVVEPSGEATTEEHVEEPVPSEKPQASSRPSSPLGRLNDFLAKLPLLDKKSSKASEEAKTKEVQGEPTSGDGDHPPADATEPATTGDDVAKPTVDATTTTTTESAQPQATAQAST